MTQETARETTGPLVSICIPTYNSARYLRQSLDSVTKQTYRSVEVIIADNASTDETVVIAREYADKYGYQLVESSSNIGPLNNWNRLVSLASGTYVAIYHSDDIYEATIVAESVAVLERQPEVALVGALAQVIDESGDTLFNYELPTIIQQLRKSSYCYDEVLAAVLGSGEQKIFLVTPSLMVRRDAYREAGHFDEESYRSSGDYEMWLRIARLHNVAVIEKALMRYRVHAQQGSEMERQKLLQIPDIIPVLAEYGAYAHDGGVRQLCDRFVARRYLAVAIKQNRNGLFDESRRVADMIRTTRYWFAAQVVAVASRLGLRLPGGAQ